MTLGLIPARSGSKGIVGKNVRMFAGKPLLAHAIAVAQQTCDKVFVSTDDVNIGALAAQYGSGVILRPKEFATDEAPMLCVVQHALREVPADVVVLLQPTQPFRTVKHVKDALDLLDETMADSVVSVVEVPQHYSPDYVLMREGERLAPWGSQYSAFGGNMTAQGKYRRQDCRPAYSRDGSVYAIRSEVIAGGSLYGFDCRALIIPRNESVTLDTEEDWALAEARING